ncbi:tyrosine-protein phosphatase [Kitasatospora sp. NBC_01287]|uniref:tyrosine-protein phosphatase n=1 Tax=Kitasatospora sp. NBC_01287 TaxID=2903573 RepID=UPI002250B2C3|nr:tyrosine-protein phosphatase [Kitasatospora sp. NBC_01287]MCX4747941.1 tyrosine-protein phosphatase [Kitasatospora sp. NBC_01287]
MTEQPVAASAAAVEELAARSLGLAGAVNARDLGGYRTADGRVLRSGVALRSDGLNRLVEADLPLFTALGVRHVVDLRSLDEVREAGPDRVPGLPVAEISAVELSDRPLSVSAAGPDGITLHHLPVFAADYDIYVALRDALADRDPAKQEALLGEGRAAQMMIGLYRWFVTDALARERFATVLRLLAAPDGPPVLFHCTAGKDRTGWTAALLLTALGVDQETVYEDYLLTNVRSAAIVEHIVDSFGTRGLMADPSLLLPLFRADRDYLAAAFAEVETGWGDFQAFWRDGLGLEEAVLAGLRKNLLGDAGH